MKLQTNKQTSWYKASLSLSAQKGNLRGACPDTICLWWPVSPTCQANWKFSPTQKKITDLGLESI